jgi:hypothetical protein
MAMAARPGGRVRRFGPVRKQPVAIMADPMAAHLQPAAIAEKVLLWQCNASPVTRMPLRSGAAKVRLPQRFRGRRWRQPRARGRSAGRWRRPLERAAETALRRLVARQAVLKLQERAKERLPVGGEIGEIHAGFSPADARRQRHRQRLEKVPPTRMARARIRNLGETGRHPGHQGLKTRAVGLKTLRRPQAPLRSLTCDCHGA